MSLIISDEVFGRVMKSMGYPIITISDLSGGLMTEEQFKDFVLYDALQEYFSWFPIEDKQEYSVGTSFEIDFPSEEVYDVVDYRMITTNNSYMGKTGSPFINAVQTSTFSSTYSRGQYGTPYHYGSFEANATERMARQAVIDQYKVVNVQMDYQNRKVTGYTNYSGKLNITWAKKSDNFDDVPFAHQTDVIELMRAETFLYFGNLRNQSAGSTDVDLDGGELVSQGERIKENIMEKFRDKPKIVVIR